MLFSPNNASHNALEGPLFFSFLFIIIVDDSTFFLYWHKNDSIMSNINSFFFISSQWYSLTFREDSVSCLKITIRCIEIKRLIKASDFQSLQYHWLRLNTSMIFSFACQHFLCFEFSDFFLYRWRFYIIWFNINIFRIKLERDEDWYFDSWRETLDIILKERSL
jgi:hypothetical protein